MENRTLVTKLKARWFIKLLTFLTPVVVTVSMLNLASFQTVRPHLELTLGGYLVGLSIVALAICIWIAVSAFKLLGQVRGLEGGSEPMDESVWQTVKAQALSAERLMTVLTLPGALAAVLYAIGLHLGFALLMAVVGVWLLVLLRKPFLKLSLC